VGIVLHMPLRASSKKEGGSRSIVAVIVDGFLVSCMLAAAACGLIWLLAILAGEYVLWSMQSGMTAW